MSFGYVVIAFCALGQIASKAEMHIYYEDLTVEEIDSTYLDPEKTDSYITEENMIAMNLSIVKKFPPATTCHVKILGLALGDYVKATGIDHTKTFCEAVADKSIVGPFFRGLGITIEDCPPKPGNYVHPNYTPPSDNLPDDFPEDRYLAIFEILVEQKPVLLVNLYFKSEN